MGPDHQSSLHGWPDLDIAKSAMPFPRGQPSFTSLLHLDADSTLLSLCIPTNDHVEQPSSSIFLSSKCIMMAMDVKGITWVGDVFQKFGDIYVEVEDTVLEETYKYIGNQMQTVGESVKKICSDVMQDLLPPSSYDLDETSASELPIDLYTDGGFSKKSFQGSKKINVEDDTDQPTEDSRINHDVDIDVIHVETCDSDALFKSASCNSVKGNNVISHAKHGCSTDIKSNLGSDENQQNKNMPASKTINEISLSRTDICSKSQSCEPSWVNQNREDTVSKPAYSEVTTFAPVSDCCNEIASASNEEIPHVLVLAESLEEKEMHSNSYSSSVISRDPFEITETWDLDLQKVSTIIKQGQKIMQQHDELKLEETCVLVTRDELQSVAIAGGNIITIKNKKRQPFSLSKKAARRQEYEELAMLHRNNEKEKGDCADNLCSTLQNDHKKLVLPDISEPEWELL
ncbi:hypothetical protein VNO78_13796 [Psophocarpus tetragonolobus]|uniref:Uncharacterized protein n=1 Tax=Psophocarpus tetragonolobus TaxID=3891 RepID=A0AAN9SRK7_PSOTE